MSYKVKASVLKPEDTVMAFEHTHEAIIDEDIWERVQELRKQRKRPNQAGPNGLQGWRRTGAPGTAAAEL